MTIQDVVKVQLGMIAWREAVRFGGVNNMIAVALVVRNRVNAGWHGADWLAVIANHDKYAATSCPEGKPFPDFNSVDVRDLFAHIDEIYSGTFQDTMTDEALYYCETNRVESSWFLESISRNSEHPIVATVGPVTFFK